MFTCNYFRLFECFRAFFIYSIPIQLLLLTNLCFILYFCCLTCSSYPLKLHEFAPTYACTQHIHAWITPNCCIMVLCILIHWEGHLKEVDLGSWQWSLLQAVTALKKGAYLLKYGRRGKPKFCPFRLANVSCIIWDNLIRHSLGLNFTL